MSSSQKRRLDRRNAIKNIEYDPSRFACEWPPSPFRSQSLEDLGRGNFRVRGTDGEFDRICSFLGLSGPDDFAIPAAAWEARKSRPDHFPSPSSGTSHNLDKHGVSGFAEDALSDAFQAHNRVGDQCSRSSNGLVNPSEVQARVREVQAIRYDYNESRVRHDCIDADLYPAEAQGRVREIEEIRYDYNESRVRRNYVEDYLTDAFQAQIQIGDKCSPSKNNGLINQAEVLRKIDEVLQDDNESRISARCNGVGGCGIKGDQPPLLVRPVAIKQPVVDNVSSTWDLLRSFGPQDNEELYSTEVLGVTTTVMLKEVDRGIDEDGKQIVGEIGDKLDISRVLVRDDSVGLESCLDTSNLGKDEESSNAMTREPLNCISPNGGFKRSIKGWQKGDYLGSGSFGTVYEGFTDHGFFFAVKEVSLLDQGSQGKQSIYQLEQEISLLSQFEHENIVKYLGTDMDDSKLYIFLELVTKGSLANLYQKYQLRDSQVSAYTRQILNGLNYLHSRNVVHRDIKCANILVHASGSVKLADFGLAKATKLNDIKSSKGTAFWMAPEVVNLKNRGYGLAADIWSLGCTVLEMLTRKVPYSHLEGMQALFRIGKGERPLIPSSLSVDAQDFIFKCLQVVPDDRPTAAQLLDHPFVKRQLSSLSVPPSLYHNGTRA